MAQLELRMDHSEINNLQKWFMQLTHDYDPNLQPDTHDIKHLLLLKRQYEEAEENLTKELNLKKTHIYSINSKTDEKKNLLKSEHVCLSDDTWKKVESLAGLAAKMNVKEINLTNLLLAICCMKNESMRNEERRINNCALLSSYSQQNLKIKKSNDILQSQLDSLKEMVEIQEPNKVKIVENINFFNAKSKEYKHSVKMKRDRLKEVKFEKSLQHSSLVEWSEMIEALEENLKISMKKLNNYKKLPPNEKLTQLKIQEKKEELMQLENEFTNIMETWEKYYDIKDI